jgi:outer membrane autotransporter protein
MAASATATSDIVAANTAFLTQSTAFVSAPPNPQPGQEGGGVWVRGVGGDLTFKSSQTLNLSVTGAGVPGTTASTSGNCTTKFRETFGGVQVGADVARLNIGGWNFHLGTTAGAIWSSGSIVGGSPTGGIPNPFTATNPVTQTPFDSTSQSPFVGGYVAATKGNFFFDALIRYDNHDLSLNSPGASVFDQKLDAHGFSASTSAGYNYNVPDSKWFIEPSAGLIWSRTTVGTFNAGNAGFGPGVQGFSGTVKIDDIDSLIGRLGLRFGTTVESGNIVYQPFAAVSIWHDFGTQITGNYQSCRDCLFVNSSPAAATASLTSTNVGTFGQYSLGVSGQIPNTGWLGFLRLDYRNGDRLESWSGTGGIRYQFAPEVTANRPLSTKAPVSAPGPVSWMGWYIGGIAGADFGRSDFIVPGFASADLRPSGVLVGGTLGYNYQIDRYVMGIEADGNWTNYTGSAACSPLITGGTPQPFFQTTCHNDMSWIATVAGRVGYLFGPRTLTYLKGGVAFGRETWSVSCNLGPENGQLSPVQTCINPAGALLNNISVSDTRVGGMIGSGVEFALTQSWSAKAEWDWIDFGSKNLTASDGTVFTAKQWSLSEVKVGVNYHF